MSEVKCSVQNKIPAAGDLHIHPPDQKLRPEAELFPPADTEGRERASGICSSGDSGSSDKKQPVKFLIRGACIHRRHLGKEATFKVGLRIYQKVLETETKKQHRKETGGGGSLLSRIRQVRESSVFRL